jgi:serine/threonine protein kinase
MPHNQQLPVRHLLQKDNYEILEVVKQSNYSITYKALRHTKVIGSFGQVDVDTNCIIKELFVHNEQEQCLRNKENWRIQPQFSFDIFENYKRYFISRVQDFIKFKRIRGIVQVLSVFEENGTVYCLMDQVVGQSLSDYIRQKGKLSAKEATTICSELLFPLELMHGKQVFHGKLTPEHVLSQLVGTEVAFHPVLIGFSTFTEPTDQIQVNYFQKDLYAVGQIMYFMLTGKEFKKEEAEKELSGLPEQENLAEITQIMTKLLDINHIETYTTCGQLRKDVLNIGKQPDSEEQKPEVTFMEEEEEEEKETMLSASLKWFLYALILIVVSMLAYLFLF